MSEPKCLSCKKCISDLEVGYECGLNTFDNIVHDWKEQSSDNPCNDFEPDFNYIAKQLNRKYAIPEKQSIEVIPKLKDYCVTYVPNTSDVEKKLMLTKQRFMKLPEDSASKLKELFEMSKEFLIDEFNFSSDLKKD